MALVSRHTSTEVIAKKNLQKNVLALYHIDFFFVTMEVLIVDEGVFRIDVRKTVEYNSACTTWQNTTEHRSALLTHCV